MDDLKDIKHDENGIQLIPCSRCLRRCPLQAEIDENTYLYDDYLEVNTIDYVYDEPICDECVEDINKGL